MVTGVVKFYNPNKSFGFITGDDGKDYFVHSSGLKEGVDITEGDKVSFEVVEGDKGLKAEQVEKTGAAAEKPEEAEESEDVETDEGVETDDSDDDDSDEDEE
ncbi:MAG: cold shock domain-containing protein [Candidatus Aenigmatarchaeota archaeon]